MKKRLLALLMAGAMLGSLLAGCAGTEDAEAPADDGVEEAADAADDDAAGDDAAGDEASGDPEPVTISVANWPSTDNASYETREAKKERFMEAYPWITLETDEYQYMVETFLPKAAAGQLPTVYNTWFTEIEKIANAGYAADITAAYERSEYYGYYDENVMDVVTVNGAVYAYPTDAYTLGMAYNVGLFEQAGLVNDDGSIMIPSTWDEVIEYAAIITEKTGAAGYGMASSGNQGGWLNMSQCWNYGVEFMVQNDDGTWTATFDSEEMLAVMQDWYDMCWVDGSLPDDRSNKTGNDIMDMMAADQIAMAVTSPDLARKYVTTSSGMALDNIAFSNLPAGDDGTKVLMGGNVQMIDPDATEEEKDAAILWMNFERAYDEWDDELDATYREEVQVRLDENEVVGPQGMSIVVKGEARSAKLEIEEELANVDLALWTYSENPGLGAQPEEPMNCQDLYELMDAMIQEIFSNKDVDLQALLTDKVTKFQTDYLDNAE